jgi:NuA3 HAT complex component NTO1
MARSNASPARTASHTHDESPYPRYDSAAAAASAMSHNESYKPREERGWEEFHSELDIDANLTVFTAEEVDGPRNELGSGSPTQQLLSAQFSGSPVLGQALQMLRQQAENAHANGSGNPPFVFTPIKRRPGRPPKRPEALLMYELGLNSPSQHITPAPLQNPKEKLVLPKPTFRRIETFAAYEKSPGVGINFVDKALANVGFQESDIFIQPRTLMRSRKTALDDDVDFILLRAEVTSNSTVPGASVGFNPRVEYDMDEQDESWLEGINAERTAQGVDIIRPQYFEIAMTLIEKEWHAVEKRK